MYVDGVLDKSDTRADNVNPFPSGEDFQVGHNFYNDHYMIGSFDEVLYLKEKA